MGITEFALKFKTSVYVLLLLIVLVGINSYRELPLESAPDVEIPIILVHTLYPGVVPEDIEKLVTNIIERELKDLKDVKKMNSSSAESSSVVQIEFEANVDMDDAYQKVRDKVDKAKPDLPEDAEDPTLIEINISEFPMMLVNISGKYGLDKLKETAEDLQDEIEQIPGVLGVDLTGGLDREIYINLDPEKMRYYNLGVGQVIGRIQEEHLTTPAGNLELGQSKFSVRIPGEYKNVSLMEDIVIKSPEGNPIKLKDIGYVVDGFRDRETISRLNGEECVTLRIKKRTGENIVRIADDIKALLKKLESKLPAGTSLMIRKDESKEIRDMVTDLENNIISGLLLVVLVLLWVMGMRNATFVAIAIPCSLLITFAVLRLLGITLNFVVLFSLILALGMLVDNSIVVIENIYRHTSEGLHRRKASIVATNEVAWPIITSTLTTVAAFAPMIFWPGIMGEFMGYLPKTVIIALLASLFVALVINPAITSDFLKVKGNRIIDESGEVRGPIMKRYKRMIEWSLDHPKTLLMISNVVLITTFMVYPILGAGIEFFPNTTPEAAQIKITAPEGTLLNVTDSYMKKTEKIASSEDNMKNIIANIGYSGSGLSLSSGGGNSHMAVADIEFKDRFERTHSTWDSIKNIRKMLKNIPGAEYVVDIEEHGPPTGAAVSVEISGDDYEQAFAYARQVKEQIATIPGVVDIEDDYESGKPEVRIAVDREKAMLRKVNTMGIAQAVRTAINGTKASVLREGDKEYDIVVRYDKNYREEMNDILNIIVTGKDDIQIPLRDVAEVTMTAGYGSINHIDQKRTVLVSADVQGRSSSEVMIDVEKLLKEKMDLAPGFVMHFSGESEEQDKAAAFLTEAFIIGIFLIMMILIAQFNSIIRPAIILGSVVMSLVGVFVGLMLTGSKFGIIMTGMGVISLAGIVVNNAIVLLDYADQLIYKHGLPPREALVRAGIVRFRPVLLTAITTILGMLPMALGVGIDFTQMRIDTGSSSVEWWGPMAQAVIFGLIFATMLTLIMVPVMYMIQLKMVAWIRKKLGRESSPVAEIKAE